MNRLSTLPAGAGVSVLKGVGPKRTTELEECGVRTVEDLLFLFPFRYEDRRKFASPGDLRPGGEPAALLVEVRSSRVIHTRRRGFRIVEAVVGDAGGEMKAVWFNQPYLKPRLTPGRKLVLFGAPVDGGGGQAVLRNPELEFPAKDDDEEERLHTGRIVPVYRRTAGLSCRTLRGLVHQALEKVDPDSLASRLPKELRGKYGPGGRRGALEQVHFPDGEVSMEALEAKNTPAWRALAFEEMFLLQLELAARKERFRRERRRPAVLPAKAAGSDPAARFPFELTTAQKRVLGEIGRDLASGIPMRRLLQGDVGSGKTAVAMAAMLQVAEAGRQAVLMAPTGILAGQHAESFRRFLKGTRYEDSLGVLTGDLKGRDRRRALEAVAGGTWRIVLGTHALFQEQVRFQDAGLVVVDEQHRFGVLQRAALAGKGRTTDLLVMTATPIPRTLAMTVYGDLDVSILDEKPPGRRPVDTRVRTEKEREKVYQGISQALNRGRQVYVVVPRVEETGAGTRKSVASHAARLQERFPDRKIGVLHGRMTPEEKGRVMERFREGAIGVLVATTVIEVGVDVPNADVMVVENADRFGLAQLHQLRGRVGRSGSRAWCILMLSPEEPGPEAAARVQAVAETEDGFALAERDLAIRGPGALLGVEQHGAGELWFVQTAVRFPELLESARKEAGKLAGSGDGGRRKAESILSQVPSWWRNRFRLAETG